MSFRVTGALLTTALLAATALEAGAAPATVPAPTPTVLTVRSGATAPAATTRRTRRRAYRHRVPPEGGVYARNAILLDPLTGEVLFEKNASRSVPIASLSKLMTALVFLEQNPDLEKEATVRADEIAGAGHTQLRRGEVVPLGELLRMSLMCSDNCATRVIAHSSGLTPDEFIARMNRKSIELGLTGTRFVEFTGLNEHNVSTAADVARLLHAAANEPLIAEITTTRSYEFHTTRRWHTIGNTNRLLYGRYEVLGGKTGFIREAGYCFATWVRAQGRDLIAVVLGAPTNATRFADAVRLIQKVPPAPTTSATTTSAP
ncbi:MAG TPA: serine hydrolase [Methylomirabilota bacterium]|jgi:D-alanyl-D-alanine endopeptidase (penicillin-binding protein 7)|nr:serine hydrolase [Methylomirabilota bacterium]